MRTAYPLFMKQGEILERALGQLERLEAFGKQRRLKDAIQLCDEAFLRIPARRKPADRRRLAKKGFEKARGVNNTAHPT